MKKYIQLMVLGIILSMHLVACEDDSSKSNPKSNSNAMAVVSIDNTEYKLPFVTCQAPHSETKAYTVMALEIEDDIIEGASFSSFGAPDKSTIVFTPRKTMDDDGYNRNPSYSANGSVDYNNGTYSFTGKFEKVINGKLTGTVQGSVKVKC